MPSPAGTISSEGPQGGGCLLELTKNGEVPLAGTARAWLQDGDQVILRGRAAPGVGFGSCSGRVVA